MKKLSILFTLMACCLMACTGGQKKTTNMETGNETLVRLETTMGNITVKLYNETPKHRDNFIKLAKVRALSCQKEKESPAASIRYGARGRCREGNRHQNQEEAADA